MRSDRLHQGMSLASLRRRWWLIASLYVLTLLLGYAVLCSEWHPLHARRWFLVAACALSYELWLFRRQLKNNHRPRETILLPTLGPGNTLTLLRGLAIGLLAGFLFSPWPVGGFAWAPGLLYTFAAIGDYLDGYLSRITHHTTELGKTLDMEIDALGVLIATTLVVQYEQLPLWYLPFGLAHHLFVCGLWWRKRQGKPVYDLPPSMNRGVIGGFQTGFLSVVLWPLFSPPGTTFAGMLFAVPLVASFTRDWCVVSGCIDPTSPAYWEIRRKIALVMTWWLPVLLRAFVVVVAIKFIIFTFESTSHRVTLFAWLNVPSFKLLAIALLLMAAIATTMLVLGAAGRLAALVLLITVCADILAAGFRLGNGLVLAGTIGIMLLGTGAFSMWQPEDVVFRRRAGEQRDP